MKLTLGHPRLLRPGDTVISSPGLCLRQRKYASALFGLLYMFLNHDVFAALVRDFDNPSSFPSMKGELIHVPRSTEN